MFKTKKIHVKIFQHYSLLIIGIILVFLILFSVYMSSTLRREATNSMLQATANVSTALDTQLNYMYSTAFKIESSDSIKQVFYVDISRPAVLFNTKNDLTSLILSINQLENQSCRINLYRQDGLYYRYDSETYDSVSNTDSDFSNQAWTKQVVTAGGKKCIFATHKDTSSENPVISLGIAFSQYYTGNPHDIIESTALTNLSGTQTQDKLNFVIDSTGNMIYPYADKDSAVAAKSYLKKIVALGSKTGNLSVNDPNTQRQYICAFARSEFSGWTAITVESETMLYQPVYSFILKIILLCIPIMIITLLLSYYISKNLSSPIKQLSDYINQLSLNTLMPKKQTPQTSDVDELQSLNNTFFEMCKRLDESLHEVVSAHSHEIQSRMLALQSQMNPHFLYNSLSAIGIMCEDHRTEEAVKYCQELSNMLRYISTNNFQPVELAKEISHTQDYLYLIKQRYENMIEFTMEIPDGMLHLQVPKLIIQPLVENCIKYGLNTEPPWIIRISGRLLSESWVISVADSGSGFSPDKLDGIKQKLSSTDINSCNAPDISNGGMGLVNIYARMKLYYGDGMIFDIKNGSDGGAVITIGGSKKGGADNSCQLIE